MWNHNTHPKQFEWRTGSKKKIWLKHMKLCVTVFRKEIVGHIIIYEWQAR